MKNLNRITRVALYVHPEYESLVFAAHALGAVGFKTIIATYGSNILEEVSSLSDLAVIVFDRVRTVEQLKYCEQIKGNERTKNIPVIAIVANDDIMQDQIINSSVDKYLRVPLDIDLFRKIVSAYLDK